MRIPAEIRAFLARHNDEQLFERISTMLGATVNKAETDYRETLVRLGHSDGYVALLSVTATLSLDGGAYVEAARATMREKAVWEGYHRGLQSALACLLMCEMGYRPKEAGEMAVLHIETTIGCRQGWGAGPTERSR